MRSQPVSPPPGSPPRRPAAPRARAAAKGFTQGQSEQDTFREIQAESGRRMRPVVAEHYGEIE
jgi:hypothetical protein